MMECGHSPTSLRERAQELKLDDISKMIDAASNGKVELKNGHHAKKLSPEFAINFDLFLVYLDYIFFLKVDLYQAKNNQIKTISI